MFIQGIVPFTVEVFSTTIEDEEKVQVEIALNSLKKNPKV
jgi:hypothetical protein